MKHTSSWLELADAAHSKCVPERGEGSTPSDDTGDGGAHTVGAERQNPDQRNSGRRLIVHCKKEPYDVYIGRPSEWGNPFSHLPKSAAEVQVANVEEAIACYEMWVQDQPQMVARIKRELKGKVLGCWCAPKPCHGSVLVKIANET